jgi:hypothetical protein
MGVGAGRASIAKAAGALLLLARPLVLTAFRSRPDVYQVNFAPVLPLPSVPLLLTAAISHV